MRSMPLDGQAFAHQQAPRDEGLVSHDLPYRILSIPRGVRIQTASRSTTAHHPQLRANRVSDFVRELHSEVPHGIPPDAIGPALLLHDVGPAPAGGNTADFLVNVVEPVHASPKSRCAPARAVQLSTMRNARPLMINLPVVTRSVASAVTGGAPLTRSGVNSSRRG